METISAQVINGQEKAAERQFDQPTLFYTTQHETEQPARNGNISNCFTAIKPENPVHHLP